MCGCTEENPRKMKNKPRKFRKKVAKRKPQFWKSGKIINKSIAAVGTATGSILFDKYLPEKINGKIGTGVTEMLVAGGIDAAFGGQAKWVDQVAEDMLAHGYTEVVKGTAQETVNGWLDGAAQTLQNLFGSNSQAAALNNAANLAAQQNTNKNPAGVFDY